jgi:hypothetical protein
VACPFTIAVSCPFTITALCFCVCGWPVQLLGDEPVWRELLQYHLDHSNPEVVQQATIAAGTLAV